MFFCFECGAHHPTEHSSTCSMHPRNIELAYAQATRRQNMTAYQRGYEDALVEHGVKTREQLLLEYMARSTSCTA